MRRVGAVAAGALLLLGLGLPLRAMATPEADAREVAQLDLRLQSAVKNHDRAVIAEILADDMVLVTGKGKVYNKADHLQQAIEKDRIFEKQDEVAGTQQVRVYGNTAIVTALLWVKGKDGDGSQFDYKVWFSDTYARYPNGWKYVFGQSSLPLPEWKTRPTD
jgi:ketosteroid isomerase-like protein